MKHIPRLALAAALLCTAVAALATPTTGEYKPTPMGEQFTSMAITRPTDGPNASQLGIEKRRKEVEDGWLLTRWKALKNWAGIPARP